MIGAMVTEIDILQIIDTYTVRMEIEALIGRLSAERITEQHLNRIDKVIEKCRQLSDYPDPKGLTGIDREMRNILHDAANNDTLRGISEGLWVKTARVWISLFDDRDWSQEVEEMLEELTKTRQALAQDKPEDVGRLRQQYLQSLNRIVKKL
jgi:DNA-binding GntR family transcriptional regulator